MRNRAPDQNGITPQSPRLSNNASPAPSASSNNDSNAGTLFLYLNFVSSH